MIVVVSSKTCPETLHDLEVVDIPRGTVVLRHCSTQSFEETLSNVTFTTFILQGTR